jgi:hypothetical protein
VASQFCHVLAMFFGRDDFHLLPVVREFSAAIKADNVGSGQSSGLGAALRVTDADWEAVPGMPATENHIHKFPKHKSTFHT